MASQPPGPAGVPVFGNTGQYARNPFRFLRECADAYGDVVRFDFGPQPVYLLTNPADVERVLVSDAEKYHKFKFGRAIDDLLGDGLLMSEGETWREQRRLADPSFHASRVADMAEMMVEKTEARIAEWEPGERIDVHLEMARLTVEVIAKAMFGVDIDEETVRKVQQNLEPLGARFEPDPRRVLVPDWAPTRENREFHEAVSVLEDVVDDVVERRRGTEGSEEDADPPMDLLSVLLRAQKRGEQTESQLRDEMVTMLLAGHDTTALALTYTWYLLSAHPDVEARFHAELDEVVQGSPTAGDVRQLSYTDRVLTESMRLYPPVYTLFRVPQVDVRHGGYRIPEGSALMLSQWAIHRDERWYDDPERFDPDRWTPERRADRPRFAYFPFGGGPRHCIGKQFSLMEAKLILATVGKRFELDYDGPEMDLRGSLTMHPAHPVTTKILPRE